MKNTGSIDFIACRLINGRMDFSSLLRVTMPVTALIDTYGLILEKPGVNSMNEVTLTIWAESFNCWLEAQM